MKKLVVSLFTKNNFGIKVFPLFLILTLLIMMLPAATPIVAADKGGPPAMVTGNTPEAGPPTSSGGEVELVVKFKATANDAQKNAVVQGTGGTQRSDLRQIRTRVIRVPASAANAVAAALSKNSSVERVAPGIKVTMAGSPDDPNYLQQWALPKIGWDQVYGNISVSGNTTIAVLDTGVDALHPDLASIMVPGQSFVDGQYNTDPNGHGTALAGIAAANVNNGTGIAGVAYAGANISSVQVLQADGTGYESDVESGIMWAADNGAKVILMGFSSQEYSATLSDAIQYAWSKGCILVAATGNNGSMAPSYPAGMPNVLGVAATDENDQIAAKSNTGSANVAAPGVNIPATLPGGEYGNIGGTSAAAAEVAGLAALCVSHNNATQAVSGNSTNQYVFDQIRAAVDPVQGESFGRINAATVMGVALTPPPAPTPSPTPTPGPQPPVYTIEAIGTPTNIGQASGTSSGTTLAVTVPSGGVAVGNTIIVSFAMNPGTAGTVSVSDTKNNTYTLDADVASGGTIRTVVFSAPVTTALTSGNTITVTHPSVTYRAVSVYYVSGLVSATPKDQAATATGTSTTPSSGTTATITQASELLFGAIGGAYYTTTTFTVGTNFTALTSALGSSGSSSSSATIQPEYRIVSATGAYSATGTLSSSRAWSAAIVTYKALLSSTTTALTSSLNPSNYGQSVTFTAAVAGTGGTPSGTVTFMDGANSLGTGTLSSGSATLSTATLGAGSHSITAVYGGDSNFTGSTSTVTTQTVNKAALIVTADAKTKVYGAANPALSATGAGLVNGDTLASLSLGYTLGTAATTTSPVAAYPITFTGGTASTNNYSPITYVVGSLTVTQAPLTVTANNTSRAYGADNPTFTAVATGLIGGDTLDSLNLGYTLNTTATPTSPLGTYPITITGGATGTTNYSPVTYVNGTLTVTVGAAAKLAFTTSPARGQVRNALSPQPVVTVQDAGGNTVTSSSAAVTLAIGNNPSGAILSGTTTMNAASGVVTFNGLSIDKGGNGYTLTASSPGLTGATSSSFNVDLSFGLNTVGSTSYTTSMVGPTTSSTTYSLAQGDITANMYTTTVPLTALQIQTYGSVTGNVKVSIYTHDAVNNRPGNRLFTEVASAVTANNWSTITIPNTYLAPGSYWIVFNSSSSNGVVTSATGVSGTTVYYAVYTYANAFPATGGSVTWQTASGYQACTRIIGVPVEGYAKATQATLYDNNAAITSMSFYSHAAGNARLSIYSGASAPSAKLWESASAACSPNAWTTVNISAGTPANLTLNAGNYWLVWQWDSPSSGPSYTAGSSGNGNYAVQSYGAFPATWTGGTASAEKWSLFASYAFAGPAGTLGVSYPTTTISGTAQTLTVTAKDSGGNISTGYTGTVHFTSSDPGAILPPDYTFVSGDGGTHTFGNVILKTAAAQSITGTDTANGTITGAQNNINVTASSLLVSDFPATTNAGEAHNITVTAQDSLGNTATNYTGTIHFTSSDSQAVLAANSNLANGAGSFSVTLKTAGTQSISATDTVTGSVTGAQSGISVNPLAKNKLAWGTQPASPATAGAAWNSFTVKIVDQYGNQTADPDTISIAPSVGTLGGTLTQPAVAGLATFNDISDTLAGTLTLTASASGLTGTPASSSMTVNAASASTLIVSGYPSPVSQFTANSFTVTAKDAYGNTATGYRGTVNFSSTDPSATLPANYPFTSGDNGVHSTFSATFNTAGTQGITATDIASGAITGTQNGIQVNTAISPPVSLGQANSTTTGTTLVVTLTTGVTVGNTIIVSFAMDPVSGTVSVADSRSNIYTSNADVMNGTSGSGTGVRTVVFSAPVTTALISGNTITVTLPSVVCKAVSIYSVSGLVSASPADKTATATASSTAPNSGNTATTTQASELIIGAIGSESYSTTFTAGTNYAALTNAIANTGSNSGSISIFPEYRIVNATGAYAANGTLNATRNWAAAIVTYKAYTGTSTSTAVTSSQPTSTYGQSVTFTATVTSSGGTPTGTVTFNDGATNLGTGNVNGSGVATFTYPSLSAGTHTITANYGGDSTFAGSSGTVQQTINMSNTSTAVTSSANPSTPGQSVTFTATVSATAPGSGTPTGTVQFTLDGSNYGAPVALSSGCGTSAAITTLAAGSHPVTAIYSGDTNFSNSTSPAINQTIGSPGYYATQYFGPADEPSGGFTIPSNACTNEPNSLYASTNTDSSIANAKSEIYGNFNFPAIPSNATISGIQVTVAGYKDSAGDGYVQSYDVALSANAGGTYTTGSGIKNTGDFDIFPDTINSVGGASDTWNRTWSPSDFLNGNFRVKLTTAGTIQFNNILYLNYVQVNVIYSLSSSTTIVTSSKNPSSNGDAVTFTATVSGTGGTPTGTVQFKIDGSNFGSLVNLSGGSAVSGSTSTLTLGSHTITAAYNGDGSFTPSTGTLTQTVTNLTITTASPLPSATVGVSYLPGSPLVTLAASGGNSPYTWSLISGDNPGLNLNSQNGAIYGLPSTAGTFTFTMQVTDSTPSTHLTATKDFSLTINPETVTANITVADKTYDGTTSATITGGTLTPAIANVSLVTSGATANFRDKNVGNNKTVDVTGLSLAGSGLAGFKGAVNYVLNPAVTATANMIPAALTVTADAKSKFYGQADPALTYQFTAGTLFSGDTLSGTLVRDPGENVGAYNILQGTLGNANYTVTFAGAQFTIDPADATVTVNGFSGVYDGNSHGASGSATGAKGEDLSSLLGLGATYINAPGGKADWSFTGGGNYKPASGSVDITISQATATVTVNGYTGVYDGKAHGATGTATGVKAEDLSSLLHLGDSFTDVPGGTASWTFDGDTNYQTASGTAAISIGKIDPTVVVTGGAFSYDGNPHPAAGAATGSGGSSVPGSFAFTYTPGGSTAPTNAGSYSVTGTFTSSDPNYNNGSGNDSISISQGIASVEVTGGTYPYDGGSHPATIVVTPSVSYKVSYNSAADAPINAGSYAVLVTVTDPNYGGTGTTTITIDPADATVTVNGFSGVYDGNSHGASGSATGAKGEDLSSLLGLGATYINAPGGKADWSFTGGGNYKPASGSVDITISQATATVTVNGYTGVYDGKAHGATGTATGVKAEDLSSLLHLGDSFTDVPGGTASWTFDGDTNYQTASGTAAISIGKIDPTVVVTGGAFSYDGNPHPAAGAATGSGGSSVPGSFAFTYTPGGSTAPTNAGSYSVTGTFTSSDPNYNNGSGNDSIAISQGTPVISWSNPADITYGTALDSSQLKATASAPGTFTYTPDAGTVLKAGLNQNLHVDFTPADTDNFQTVSADVKINVSKAAPVITWANPADITYGTALGGTQLNASSPVVGTFSYTPLAATVLNAGNSQTLGVTFTPNDAVDYDNASKNVTINVLKATAVITWGNPGDIVYGTALDNAQLDAKANVPGQLAYIPVGGTVLDAGSHTLSVTLTPDNINNYDVVTQTVTINVTKAEQTIEWSAPAGIVYGTALSGAQLNATVSVVGATPAGSLTYSPTTGTILDAGTDQHLSVTAAATGNFNAATASVKINVSKADQTINWLDPAGITYGTALSGAQLNATVTVVGPALAGALTYNPAAGTVLNAGYHDLSVTAAETLDYNSATATAGVNVGQATPVVTWADPADIIYGTALSSTQLNATASVPGTFTYSLAGGVVLIAGLDQTLHVDFTPTDTTNYKNASADVKINVSKATPVITWANPADITYGTALSGTQLNANAADVAGTFVYSPTAGTVLGGGSGQTLSVTFAPTDAANYNGASKNVTINVSKAEATVTLTLPNFVYVYDGTSKTASATTIPPGLTVSITYTRDGNPVANPTEVGSYAVNAAIVDNNYKGTATGTLAIYPPLSIGNTSPLAGGVFGSAYSQTLTATGGGGNYSYSLASGNLPPGLTLATNGAISGTPGQAGAYTFTAKVTDSFNITATKSLSINIDKATLVISWSNPPDVVYNTPLSGTQLNAAVTLNGNAVPGGYAYTPPAGTVLGAGPHILSVLFTPADSNNCNNASAQTIIIVSKATAIITLGNLLNVYDGTPKPATATTVPPGLTVSIAYAQNSNPVANPTAAGSYDVNATVVDNNYNGSQTGILIIYPSITITTDSLPGGIYNVAYSQPLSVSQGQAPYTWSIDSGALPAGLNLNANTGLISGTPTAASSNPAAFTVRVKDNLRAETTRAYSIKIDKATPTITWSNPADITFPNVLSATQLNASASAAGSMTYVPDVGNKLDAGSGQNLTVSFAPSDAANYNPVAATVKINVLKATPIITWAKPSDITYPASLGSTQLNATTNVAGTFAYTPPSGTVLNASYNQNISVAFTPTDGANYNGATASTTINVLNSASTVTLANLNQTYDGSAKPAGVTTSPSGLSYNLTYNGSSSVPANAGSYAVLATITDPNFTGTASGTLIIARVPLAVTANDASRVYGAPNPAFTTTVTGFVNNEPSSVVSGAAALTTTATSASGVGTYPINASTGTLAATNYSFTFVNGTLTINQASTVTTITSDINPSVSGQSVTLTATVSVVSPGGGTPGSSVSFYNDAFLGTSNCNSGRAALTTSALAIGHDTLRADYSGDANFAASSGSLAQNVNPSSLQIATTSLPNGTVGVAYSQTLADSSGIDPCTWSYAGNLPAGLSLNATTGVISGTPTAAGSNPLTFKVADSTSNSTTKDLSINIDKGTPVITWANPANILYGTALGNTQLNATASVAGNFVYAPAAGEILSVGSHTLNTTFTPIAASNYNIVSKDVTINVTQGNVSIIWSNPADIFYGTPLGGAQLNATTLVQGSFAYTPSGGTVLAAGLSQTLQATFTPTDTINYTVTKVDVRINVLKANPVIAWAAPADITYPTLLSSTQLNASVSFNNNPVSGALVYSPVSGTVLTTGNGQNLSATFTPTDTANYNTATATVKINVLKATPMINWAHPADITYGTALSDTQLNATASVPGSFTFAPAAGTVLSVGNNQNLSVAFIPTDTANYNGAAGSTTINVLTNSSTVTLSNLNQTYSGTAKQATVTTNPSGLSYTLTYNGSTTAPTNAGSYAVVATITSQNYTGTATGTLTIAKVPLTVTANNANRVYGAANPVFTATMTGFVNGETSSVVSGAAALTTAATATSSIGTYPITGSAGTLAATNYSFTCVNGTLTISQASTNTAVTTNLNPSVLGQSVTLTATVSAVSPATGNPGSSITFKDDGALLGTVNVTGGKAVLTLPLTKTGANTITAEYSGDTNFTASVGTLTQNVNPSSIQIATTALANGTVGVAYSQTLVDSGGIDPCTWSYTGNLPAGLSLNATTGVISGTPTAAGTATPTFKVIDSTSASATRALSINIISANPRTTTTVVISSYNPSVTGQSVTFVATVTSSGGIPTGSITFKDGTATLATATLTPSGKAILVTSSLNVAGTHSITAVYNPGSRSKFDGSVSAVLTQVVNKANTATTLKSSSNPSSFGRSVTFTATVSAQTPGSGTPTGTVTFRDGSNTFLFTATLKSGMATFSSSSLSKGTHSIVVIYNSDANYNGSTSSILNQVIK